MIGRDHINLFPTVFQIKMVSVRLIVDTGMHAFGWSKEKAISYIVDNTDANEVSAKQQVSLLGIISFLIRSLQKLFFLITM